MDQTSEIRTLQHFIGGNWSFNMGGTWLPKREYTDFVINSTSPVTASPNFSSSSRTEWPPASTAPASRTLARAPRRIDASTSAGSALAAREESQASCPSRLT